MKILTDDILQALTDEATDLLKQLVATPRMSRNESAAADILADFIEGKGISYHREANNIWCIAEGYDEQRPTLLLNAHIDTVRPVDAWTRDPFTPQVEGGRIYGLGTNDDGASLVSLLQAFRQLSGHIQHYNLIFLASAEEEVSGKDGIERALPLLPHIDVALVGEPTGMQPAVAEKGLMVLDVTAHGRAGHAARNEGVNAIYEAMKDIEWFRTYQFPDATELLGPVKMSVTVINAGTQHNVVPDKCDFIVDVRLNECYTNKQLFDIICQSVKSDVKARSFRLNSSRIDIQHPLVQRAMSLGRKPFGSPTLSDQALMSFPSMKMGPGDSARSHTADEFIEISEIKAAIRDYVQLLDGLVL